SNAVPTAGQSSARITDAISRSSRIHAHDSRRTQWRDERKAKGVPPNRYRQHEPSDYARELDELCCGPERTSPEAQLIRLPRALERVCEWKRADTGRKALEADLRNL